MLVELPRAISTLIAFSKAFGLAISLGLIFFSSNSITLIPVFLASLRRPAETAGIVPLPGKANPSASVRQFMEFAVNIPEQEPTPGQALFSSSVKSSSLIFPVCLAPTASNTSTRSIALSLNCPASIGPPLTIMAGMFKRSMAINMPGTILSQLQISTSPSKGCAIAMISTESAMSSLEMREYFIPSWPMARPSHTPIVENSIGVPPATLTPAFTAEAISFKCRWPGIISFAEFAIPIMGREIS